MVNQFRSIFLLFISCLLFACAQIQHSSAPSSHDQAASFLHKIISIDALIDDGKLNRAKKQQLSLFSDAADKQQYALQNYSLAKLAFAEQDYQSSSLLLSHPSVEEYLSLASDDMATRIHLLQAQLFAQQKDYLAAARLRIYTATLLKTDEKYESNHLEIWQLLKHLDSQTIDASSFNHEQDLQKWLQLLAIQQKNYRSLSQQVQALEKWQQHNSQHPAAKYPPKDITTLIEVAANRPQKLAIILPFDGKYRHHGAAIRDGIIHAWYQSSYQPELNFYSFDEQSGFINVYHEAIYDGADMIIGPLFKGQIKELYALGDILPVPTIALNRLESELVEGHTPLLNLIEFSLSSEDEIDSLIKLALAQEKHRALVIYQQDDWAVKAAQYFQQQWQLAGQEVISSVGFNTTREQSQLIQQALHTDKSQQRTRELQWLTGLKLHSEPRARKDIDMIFLVSRPEAAASLRPLLSFHYAGDIPVYANASVYRGYPNPAIDNDLNQIIFSDAPLLIQTKTSTDNNYKNTPYIRVFAMGLDTLVLAERVELLRAADSYTLKGASGTLRLENNLIKRETVYGQFIRGTVQPLALPNPKIDAKEASKNDNTRHR